MAGPVEQPKFSVPPKLFIILILAITCFAFVPSLSNGFVNWDDNSFIYENPNVLSLDWPHLKAIFTTPVLGAYCPLVILSFALENMAFGLNPGVFHLDNLLLHLVCVFLVFRLLKNLQLSPVAAAFGALLFGVTPMHVESVAWATERKDVLYSAFYFGALLAYLRFVREGTNRFYVIALVLFALSLLSKIQAVTLPLAMLLVDYYFKRAALGKLLREKIPFLALAIVVGIVGVALLTRTETLNPLGSTTVADRLILGIYAFWVYIVKAFVPYRMWPLYLPDAPVWAQVSAVLASIACVLWLWRAYQTGNRAIVFGFLFFTANIFLMLQILSAGATFLADRYSYVAYFGLFFLAAKAFEGVKLRPAAVAGAVIYICALSTLTWRQCAVWESGETLWTFAIRHLPNHPLPYLQRAYYYRSLAETATPEAKQLYFTKSLADYDQAVRLIDPEPNTREKVVLYNSRAQTLFEAGHIDAAIADYSKVIELDPSYGQAYVNRGVAYAKAGQPQAALADLNHALALEPNNPGALFTRALIYKDIQKPDLAIEDFNTYLASHPTDGDAYLQRSKAFLETGKTNEALRDANLAKDHGIDVDPAYISSITTPHIPLHR